ncbi:Gfo/Idh/MocA family oxidoreductase [Marinobacter salinisoli]|uniref:Gfo/Idh/MocA family oxidoreductase n=1 Tax=Marinobacter salinisoli TaxID=2769486 RepID=A0ABX7MRK3_9GAMM|nr:Gfo/Idh/MocA family oxidoreductase [Marinobacter salinisoli]QSP94914.1 Gfo/Idh/MocA family oxidoreductase [Marinobacter salinisoli]
MEPIRIGIVGTGMIAGVIANAIKQSDHGHLVAVASRRHERAAEFAQEHGIAEAYGSWQELVQAKGIDAVYVATPTAGREEICLAALNAGKHLISEKPFLNAESVKRIASAAEARGLSFMDATHFTHHPRTQAVVKTQQADLGRVNRVRTSFFFPFMDRENIRFDSSKEPTGAVGDMAWYNMRAIVEFMRPTQPVKTLHGTIRRDDQTGAVVGGTGMIEFEGGQVSSFDFGYDAGVCQMDLDIIGEQGLIQMDDYVLDWKDGFAFNNPEHVAQFRVRQDMAAPEDFKPVLVPTPKPQAANMIDGFCRLVRKPSEGDRLLAVQRALQTQSLLDRFCQITGLTQ